MQLTGDKLSEAYKNIFAGGFTAESIDKLNLEKVKLKFTSQIDDLTNEIRAKIAQIEATKKLIEDRTILNVNFRPKANSNISEDEQKKDEQSSFDTTITRHNESIAKSQAEINALLRQRTTLTQQSAQAENAAYATSIAGLREYLTLLKSGDPFIQAALANDHLTQSLQKQIAEYQKLATSTRPRIVLHPDPSDFLKKFLPAIQQIGDVIHNAADQWDGTFKGFFSSVWQGFKEMIKQIIADMLALLAVATIVGLVSKAFGGDFKDSFKSTIKSGGDTTGGQLLGAAFGYSSGGYTGEGGKYDIAGYVHKKEFVMPMEAVSKFGLPFMNAIANQQMPSMGFASGGYTGGYMPSSNYSNSAVSNKTTNVYNVSLIAPNMRNARDFQQSETQIKRSMLNALQEASLKGS